MLSYPQGYLHGDQELSADTVAGDSSAGARAWADALADAVQFGPCLAQTAWV